MAHGTHGHSWHGTLARRPVVRCFFPGQMPFLHSHGAQQAEPGILSSFFLFVFFTSSVFPSFYVFLSSFFFRFFLRFFLPSEAGVLKRWRLREVPPARVAAISKKQKKHKKKPDERTAREREMKDNERYLRIIKDGKRAILDFDLDLSTKAQTNEENMKMH